MRGQSGYEPHREHARIKSESHRYRLNLLWWLHTSDQRQFLFCDFLRYYDYPPILDLMDYPETQRVGGPEPCGKL